MAKLRRVKTKANLNLSADKTIQELISRIDSAVPGDSPVKVDGVWGSFAPMLCGHLSKSLKRPILYISPHIDDADNVADDITVFDNQSVEVFPVWESRETLADATDEIAAQRMRISLGLAQAKTKSDLSQLIISTCIQALNQPVPQPSILTEQGLTISTNQTLEPELVASWLVDNGFERVDAVDVPGQFAQRGGIIDIFAPVTTESANNIGQSASREPAPIRVEFFGDTVESIRRIDLDSQLSTEKVAAVCVVAPTSHEGLENTALFINLLPPETCIILAEPIDIAEVAEVYLDRVEDPRGLYAWQAVHKAISKFTCIEISKFGSGGTSLDVSSAQQYEHKSGQIWKSHKDVLDELVNQTLSPNDKTVLMYCENAAEVKRVIEIVCQSHEKMPENFKLPIGFIHQGFIVNSLDTIIISHHEVFGQYAVRRKVRTIRSASPVGSLVDLNKGDCVVHLTYGIGKFQGIKTITDKDRTSEFITLEYADKVLIHVPVHNISLIQKYIGSLPKRPQLSKIGTKKWENQKRKVAEGVAELAEELLQNQAKRENLPGYACPPDSTWQNEFEESFVYQETPDQLTSISEIKADMMQARPMDRLLCGDVGYGKTEIAMRAAFKAVESGKQVAILVPTTVLCVQHGRTFKERMADFPVTVEVMNRFVTAKKNKEVVACLKHGSVDIVIGTHRLLSSDVDFKDLGLLIIDEEQRFGVAHKEKLKKFKINVDVLTMTATPIPRTLHMSLLGLRDISSLSTPPLDRRSVVTRVCKFDKQLVRKAIMQEINRDGQVFFLHNRVQTIERMAEQIRKLVKDSKVRVSIGHGQMTKTQLEKAMLDFVNGRTHILVCSTIIESGLDIPNANTMIINNADRFGLAQMHQLRGRVGRYKHRAYAYMLTPADRSITPVSAKRLKAIEEYSQLGAGFRIALRDLEIRGAGNILGAQQSGHINTVGYEMYCRLLTEAVKRLKNEPIDKPVTAVVDLGFSTYIPKSYIPADRQRMDVYRRIAAASGRQDLKRLEGELKDLFGPVPEQVQLLLDMSEIRVLANDRGIKSLNAVKPDLVFRLDHESTTSDLFARAPGSVRVPDPTTVHIRLTENYFETKTLMATLRKLLKRTGRKK